MSDIALKHPGVKHSIAFPGLSINGFVNAPNTGIVFMALDDLDKRRDPSLSGPAIARALNQEFLAVKDAFVIIFPPPPVNGLGTIGGFKFQVEDRAGLGEHALDEATQALMTKA